MKITEILAEATKANLASYLQSRDNFQLVGHCYVFLWTNSQLKELLKAGAKSGEDLQTLRTPGSTGIGIINARTGDLCVGAIDHDYEALWASSMDVSDFFVNTRNRKLLQLPNRLQNLADMLSQASEQENDSEKPNSSGVAGIIDALKKNFVGNISLNVGKISKMSSVLDVKEYLENYLKDIEDKMEQRKIEIRNKQKPTLNLEELEKMFALESEIEFLLGEKHLFNQSDDEEDEESETVNLDSRIEKWGDNFNRDFPNCDLDNAYLLDPNN